MTCASRSGRKATEPSLLLTSPTCMRQPARRFSRASNSRSTASICGAQREQIGIGSAEVSAMAVTAKFSHVGPPAHCTPAERHRVVQARAHPAHALVPLQLQQSPSCAPPQEGVVAGVVRKCQEERDARARAAVDRSTWFTYQPGPVDAARRAAPPWRRCAPPSPCRHAALRLEPLEHQPRDVDRIGRRRVVASNRCRATVVL